MKVEELKIDLDRICTITKRITETLINECESRPGDIKALGLRELAKRSDDAYSIAYTLLVGLKRGDQLEAPAATEPENSK